MSDNVLYLKIPQYILVSHYSRSVRAYGGVVIYVLENVKYRAVDRIIDHCVEMDVEFRAAELVDFNVVIGCVYRPSASRRFDVFLSCFEKFVQALNNSQKDICILGNFNLDLMRDRAGLANGVRDILELF